MHYGVDGFEQPEFGRWQMSVLEEERQVYAVLQIDNRCVMGTYLESALYTEVTLVYFCYDFH